MYSELVEKDDSWLITMMETCKSIVDKRTFEKEAERQLNVYIRFNQ
jgi:hypothetical protein